MNTFTIICGVGIIVLILLVIVGSIANKSPEKKAEKDMENFKRIERRVGIDPEQYEL